MKIVINITQQGVVSVEGPLSEKIFMWGVLEAAKEAVRAYNPEAKSVIEIPQLMVTKDPA